MATDSSQTEEAIEDDSVLWCNFCGFKTSDQELYLKHSCKEILEAQGQSTAPTDLKECR